MTPRPWSTQPVTGAQHDAWLAEYECRMNALLEQYYATPDYQFAVQAEAFRLSTGLDVWADVPLPVKEPA